MKEKKREVERKKKKQRNKAKKREIKKKREKERRAKYEPCNTRGETDLRRKYLAKTLELNHYKTKQDK